MDGKICQECGYVHLVFPKTVPETISRFEKERIAIHRDINKQNARQLENAKREAEATKAMADDITLDLENYKKRYEQVIKERDDINSQYRSLLQKVSSLEKDNKDLQSNSSRDNKRLKSEINELNNVISTQLSEMNRLRSSLSELKRQLWDAENTPKNELRGIVIIEDVRHSIRAAFPVYDGTNTYGSNPDLGLHHQIKFIVRGYTFNPVHFSVRTTQKGLVFEPFQGVEAFQNGGQIRSGVYARQADNFMLGDKVRINISPV